MTVSEDNLSGFLRKNGLKFTQERKAVLTCAAGIKGHFDPESLYECLKNKGEKASRASVYRALPILLKSGVIQEAFRDKNGVKYEYTQGKSHHDHMECVRCGKIVEFHNEEIEKLQDSVGRRHGFVLTGHNLELKGLCRECHGKGANKMSPITYLKEGETGSITGIEGEGRLKSRLEAMGIRTGAQVRKISGLSGSGPVVFISGRTQVALGKSMASKIMIKKDYVNEK
jgi:Fur family transcriptional regulator, ferric uptake regulator